MKPTIEPALPSNYLRADRADDLFPRGEHPDTRSNAEFLKAIGKKIAHEQHVKGRLWYPEKRQPGRTGYKIRCITNGKIYDTIRQAANELKLDNTNIGRHLKGHENYSHVGGYQFEIH